VLGLAQEDPRLARRAIEIERRALLKGDADGGIVGFWSNEGKHGKYAGGTSLPGRWEDYYRRMLTEEEFTKLLATDMGRLDMQAGSMPVPLSCSSTPGSKSGPTDVCG